MMLQRLAMQDLLTWKQTKTQQALMIMGARQVGKTTLVRSFAKGRYDTFAELNFLGNTQAVQTLKVATNADDLLLRISALTGKTLSPGRTLLFLDEIQECKDLLTWTKFLTERMDIDIILSGSLLGLDAYVQARSLPVGFLRKLTLYPLTFEEFARACDVSEDVWQAMENALLAHEKVPDFIHDKLSSLFRTYLLVGGMPDAVQAFVNLSQLTPVRGIQNDIVDLYESDIVKYVADVVEARQIKMVYESIPAQLNTPAKRFKYARLGKNLVSPTSRPPLTGSQAPGLHSRQPRWGRSPIHSVSRRTGRRSNSSSTTSASSRQESWEPSTSMSSTERRA